MAVPVSSSYIGASATPSSLFNAASAFSASVYAPTSTATTTVLILLLTTAISYYLMFVKRNPIILKHRPGNIFRRSYELSISMEPESLVTSGSFTDDIWAEARCEPYIINIHLCVCACV